MVRIFRNSGKGGNGEFVVQSNCLDAQTYLVELAEALAGALRADSIKGEEDYAALGILQNAVPIMFKLCGYKADEVREQRTLVCGTVSPEQCEHVFSVRADAK
jgi:hypothetical protein